MPLHTQQTIDSAMAGRVRKLPPLLIQFDMIRIIETVVHALNLLLVYYCVGVCMVVECSHPVNIKIKPEFPRRASEHGNALTPYLHFSRQHQPGREHVPAFILRHGIRGNVLKVPPKVWPRPAKVPGGSFGQYCGLQG